MSQQNITIGTSASSDLPVKRKRGRPRKDKNVVVKESSQLALVPASDDIQKIQEAELNQSTGVDKNMVGRVVSGVIEGIFDSGYLLSVKIGNSNTLLRGVVFQPGKVNPVTAVNDVAPNVKMYKPQNSPFPEVNPSCQANGSVPQSVHTIEQPLQVQNQVPVEPNQVVPPVFQSSVPVALGNPSAPVIFPVNNLTQNVNGSSLAGKTTPEKRSECEVLSESSSIAVPLTNASNIESDMPMGGMKVNQQQNSDFRCENQPASAMVPVSSMPNNIPSASLDVGKVALQPTQQFAFEEQSPPLKTLKMVEQDEVMQVFEAPVSEPMGDIFPGNKTSDQLPPFLNQAEKSEVELHQTSPASDSQFLLSEPQTESEPCPTEQVHNVLHNSNLELLQTPVVTYSQLVPKESEYVDSGAKSSEPMHTKIADSSNKLNENTPVAEPQLVIPEPTSEPMEIGEHFPVPPTKEKQLDPTEKDLSKYETSDNGKLVHDAGGNTEAVSRPSPKTEVALPAKPAEESGFSGLIDSKITSSPVHNTDMDFACVEAQSQC
ncbi:uncharacterized protein LOC141724366 [Apium graveolens]|uniref:uncharacterized protein LOC141724366 n=1 Tax=Apium graveolens TaxID=4045 RepID=UPI003D79EFD1